MNSSNNSSLLCFFGHHKCGTQWIQGILRELCQDMGLKYGHAFNAQIFDCDLETFITHKRIEVFSYTNANYQYVKNLRNFRGFHVIRDPRDIVVSAYFSHLYSHPTDQNTKLEEEKEILQGLSKDEGLFQEIKFNYDVFKAMYEWNYSLENVIEIKMEDIMRNPYSVFVDIFRFLGIVSESRPKFNERWSYLLALTALRSQQLLLKKTLLQFRLKTIPYERILGIVYENEFAKKSRGRKPGQENTTSHYRKGVAGDWQNHFTQEHIDFFKSQYNDLLIKLGYEQDDNW
ncbi:MAG: sulfotransferase domain-containing protein [Microcystaceae cyanobacterium]